MTDAAPHVKRADPDPIDLHVGMRIRQRRVGTRMSQTRLGQAIGVTFQQVQKYENGSNRIGASTLFKIAAALGVDVAYLFVGLETGRATTNPQGPDPAETEPARHDNYKSDPLASREGIELVHNFAAIRNAEVRRKLGMFVRTLAEAETGR